MDETGHGGRGDHNGEGYGQTEDGALGRHVCDIAHDAWTEPHTAVEGFVRVASDEACVGRGVEGPCFGAGAVSRDELEVFGVDERFEAWFFRGAIWCGFASFVCQGLGPFFGDGGGVEDALQGVTGKAFFDDGRGVNGGVGVCGVAAGIFVYYYVVLSARTRVGGLAKGLDNGDRLPGPPGWSGAKPVRSHTCPSTTIQQSASELCFETSETDRSLD